MFTVVDVVGSGDFSDQMNAASLDLEDRRILLCVLLVLEQEYVHDFERDPHIGAVDPEDQRPRGLR